MRHSWNQLSAADKYVTAIASTHGSDACFQINGTVLALLPDVGAQPLFGCSGYRLLGADPLADGWALRGREVLLFTDLATGAVLDSWRNPITNAVVDVVHDWLDPVCSLATSQTVPAALQVNSAHTFESSATETCTNPLRPHVFVRESTGVLLQRSEHTLLTLVGDAVQESVVRFTPWLPWMLLGGTEGSLVFHLTGGKVPGFDSLPESVRRVVNAQRPEFAFAPKTWIDRRENSWSLYFAEHQPA